MKKTGVQKLRLNRETLRKLMSKDLAGIHGGAPGSGADWCSVPSCIDGCPSAMCTSIVPDDRG